MVRSVVPGAMLNGPKVRVEITSAYGNREREGGSVGQWRAKGDIQTLNRN